MALKPVPIWTCCTNQQHCCVYPQSWKLGFSHDGYRGSGSRFLNFKANKKWECLVLLSETERAVTPVEDEEPLAPPEAASPGIVEENQIIHSKRFHRDLQSLPKPLSATDLSCGNRDGSKVRVAYQGIPGAYSEAAALKAYPKCETVPCDQFEAAFKAVELWLVDRAVLPIENSVAGSIHRNYDLLLRHRLHIVGEVQLLVNHCLLGLPGIRKEELKRVVSHPQALEQCNILLNKLGVTRINSDDTSGAAQIVASEALRDTGAVASARAAEIYGLSILAERIQDDPDNITRFLILAREPIIPGTDRPYKTSIVFTLEEGPGVLFKALAVFALREINLTKIESRPQKQRPLRVVDDSNKGSAKYFDYLFYIDFEASMADPRAQYALEHLQEFARFIRVLGCYPMDTNL
ncbi:Arogenate dehydratase/prephenate dehydratase 1, chloroplastic [Capsicum annuum]|uniref:Arogenate dehydratase n=1 Tax=Capsicum annuum TaxID=4072 RepID=A0A1U8FWM0_CAPAN|nr:arogenate dehydratase/prephenate dehydratase 1, chloroplastic [Capsicum annuum]KAF3616594.1 Arogenate dehydratase/prephenate dehydratase 1, chloroplastic [Capsicum annuum]PHT90773.1 Arogenate dehydratase/prephenate dehydratase 1, chloroplastic [Capsicum annuum]